MNKTKNANNYLSGKNTWIKTNSKEKFFVSYAVSGPMINPSMGVRKDIPVNQPISGPVKEPSPLNNRYLWSPKLPDNGVGIL